MKGKDCFLNRDNHIVFICNDISGASFSIPHCLQSATLRKEGGGLMMITIYSSKSVSGIHLNIPPKPQQISVDSVKRIKWKTNQIKLFISSGKRTLSSMLFQETGNISFALLLLKKRLSHTYDSKAHIGYKTQFMPCSPYHSLWPTLTSPILLHLINHTVSPVWQKSDRQQIHSKCF